MLYNEGRTSILCYITKGALPYFLSRVMRPAELPSRSAEKRYVHLLSTLLIPIFEGEGRVACRPRFARECNADHDRHAMGKNRERVRFSPRPGRRGSPGEGRTCRTRRAARRLSRLLRGEISSCSTSWRGAGTRAFRSEIARRHAGGPRLSRPYPRRPRPHTHVGLGA